MMKRLLKKLLASVIREVTDERVKELHLTPYPSAQEFEKVVKNELQRVISTQNRK